MQNNNVADYDINFAFSNFFDNLLSSYLKKKKLNNMLVKYIMIYYKNYLVILVKGERKGYTLYVVFL